MKDVVGSPGTRGGLALRVSQFVCAAGSLAVMGSAFGYSNYSAFCYLVFQMMLQLIWSFILICVDILSLKTNWDLHSAGNLWKYVIGDWVIFRGAYWLRFWAQLQRKEQAKDTLIATSKRLEIVALHLDNRGWNNIYLIMSMGSMAAASSSTGVAILLETDVEFCKVYPYLSCSRYKVSVILASMAWSFMAASACSTFWLLVSLSE